jgi:dTDP-4-dehydrorhamnose 3,5-epimerase
MTSRFIIHETPLESLFVIERRPIYDHRGLFERLFCSQELNGYGLNLPIAQINRTLSRRKATVRGMHFQNPPHCDTKLVTCTRGEIYDVAVDLREGSPTLLRWHAEVLSETNHRSLLVPQGFAHGFQALSDDCELLYLHSAPHRQGAEGAISPIEPRVGVTWPLPIEVISERDANHPPLPDNFNGLRI